MDGCVLSKKGWVPFPLVAHRLKFAAPLSAGLCSELDSGTDWMLLCVSGASRTLLSCVSSYISDIHSNHLMWLKQWQGFLRPFFSFTPIVSLYFLSWLVPMPEASVEWQITTCSNTSIHCNLFEVYSTCITSFAGASLQIHHMIYTLVKLAVYFSCSSCRKLLFWRMSGPCRWSPVSWLNLSNPTFPLAWLRVGLS